MKITDQIHILRLNFEINLPSGKRIPRYVNSIIIFGKYITLIDTGIKGSDREIYQYIRKQGRDPHEINTIILSHAHPDHIGSAASIKEFTDAKVLAHSGDKAWIENIDLQNRERPVPGFFGLVDEPVKVDELIEHQQEFSANNNVTLQFRHAPGYSKGAINVFFKEDKLLFTGDSIPLKNDIPNYDNFRDVWQTLQNIKNNNGYSTLLSSWAPPLNSSEATLKIQEGEVYISKIDKAVKENYTKNGHGDLDSCFATVKALELPHFLVNPIVDKTFRSHLR